MKKRITILEIIVSIFILSVFALFISPNFIYSKTQRQEANVRANTAMAVSSVKGIFSLKVNKNTASDIAMMLSGALNKITKNPVDKKNVAYTVNSPAEGSVSFETNNPDGSMTIKGYAQDTKTPLITQVIPRK